MASFTNVATLSYNGNLISSNTVTGELQEALSASKTAALTYTPPAVTSPISSAWSTPALFP